MEDHDDVKMTLLMTMVKDVKDMQADQGKDIKEISRSMNQIIGQHEMNQSRIASSEQKSEDAIKLGQHNRDKLNGLQRDFDGLKEKVETSEKERKDELASKRTFWRRILISVSSTVLGAGAIWVLVVVFEALKA